MVSLGEVCTLQNGFAFKSKDFVQEGVPVLRISSIQNEEVCDNRPVFVNPNSYKEDLSRYIVANGDLLIAMSGATTGKVGFNNTGEEYLLNQRVGKFKPSAKLDLQFLFYYLSSKVEENLKISAGSAQPNLSTAQIKAFQIPLPSLPEQKRIVAILDEAFAGIDEAIVNTEKNLAAARELFESYLNTIFTQKGEGWETKPLKGYCSDYKSAIVDGPFGSNLKKEHFVESGVPVLKIQNIKSYKIIDKKLNYVTYQKASELSRHAFKRGDIVMTKLGNPLGVSAIVENMDSGVIVADLVRVRADKINTEYLCYQLNSPVIKSFINSKQKGATRPRVKITIVRDLPIAAPSSEDQERIVLQINQISEQVKRTEDIYRQKIASLNELKQSLLQKAFSGELTANMADEAKAEAAA